MRDGDDWCVRVMDNVSSVPLDHPCVTSAIHEAEAFARLRRKAIAD
jgi:hypothetical protein